MDIKRRNKTVGLLAGIPGTIIVLSFTVYYSVTTHKEGDEIAYVITAIFLLLSGGTGFLLAKRTDRYVDKLKNKDDKIISLPLSGASR